MNQDNEPSRWELIGAVIVTVSLTALSALALVSGSVLLYMNVSGAT